MSTYSFTLNPNNKVLTQQSVNQWNEILQKARMSLFGHQWQNAVNLYWRAYTMAEPLLKNSPCKNCATKGYVRTLIEMAYALCKNHQHEKLAAIIQLAQPTWATHLSAPLAKELIAMVSNISNAPIADTDVWIEKLFAMDEAITQPLH